MENKFIMRFAEFENRLTINLLYVYFEFKFNINIIDWFNPLICFKQSIPWFCTRCGKWIIFSNTLSLSCTLTFDEMHVLQNIQLSSKVLYLFLEYKKLANKGETWYEPI